MKLSELINEFIALADSREDDPDINNINIKHNSLSVRMNEEYSGDSHKYEEKVIGIA